jgi:hypothetical protein
VLTPLTNLLLRDQPGPGVLCHGKPSWRNIKVLSLGSQQFQQNFKRRDLEHVTSGMVKPNCLGVLRKRKEELGYTPDYTQEGRLQTEPLKDQGLMGVILHRRWNTLKRPRDL